MNFFRNFDVDIVDVTMNTSTSMALFPFVNVDLSQLSTLKMTSAQKPFILDEFIPKGFQNRPVLDAGLLQNESSIIENGRRRKAST